MDAELISQRLFELQGRQPGYQRGAALASLGIPNKYIRASQWESPAAFRAYFRSAALAEFLQANPAQGIVTSSRLEGFETVAMHSEPGTPTFAVLVDGIVAPGKAAAFEQSRNEGMALIRASGVGNVTSILARSLANQNHYVVYHSFLTPEAQRQLAENPQFQGWRQQHLTGYWASGQGSVIEQFEVVMVHAPVPV